MKLSNLRCCHKNCKGQAEFRIGVADKVKIYCKKHFNQHTQQLLNKKEKEVKKCQ